MNELEQHMFRALSRIEERLAKLGFVLHTQYEVQEGRFRLDFALIANDGRKLAIETDGHWHEKTPVQVEYDRKRERELSLDWRVLRFTAIEVLRNVSSCVDEILIHAQQITAIRAVDIELRRRATVELEKFLKHKNELTEKRKIRNEEGIRRAAQLRKEHDAFFDEIKNKK